MPTVVRSIRLVDVAESAPPRAVLDHWYRSFQRLPLGSDFIGTGWSYQGIVRQRGSRRMHGVPQGCYWRKLGRIGHLLNCRVCRSRDLRHDLSSARPRTTHLFGESRPLGEHPQICPPIHEQQDDIANEQSHCHQLTLATRTSCGAIPACRAVLLYHGDAYSTYHDIGRVERYRYQKSAISYTSRHLPNTDFTLDPGISLRRAKATATAGPS